MSQGNQESQCISSSIPTFCTRLHSFVGPMPAMQDGIQTDPWSVLSLQKDNSMSVPMEVTQSDGDVNVASDPLKITMSATAVPDTTTTDRQEVDLSPVSASKPVHSVEAKEEVGEVAGTMIALELYSPASDVRLFFFSIYGVFMFSSIVFFCLFSLVCHRYMLIYIDIYVA